MLELFVSAVQEFGPPSRVRTDQLFENTEVATFMLTHPLRGPGQKILSPEIRVIMNV